jgi:hypothetical protein
VAKKSGLLWVNSDAAKIAQVQAAIAAEPFKRFTCRVNGQLWQARS